MNDDPFVDYYELIEVSPKAGFATIEIVGRFLAKQFQKDQTEPTDKEKFTRFVTAYKTLSNPELRTGYDRAYTLEKERNAELVKTAEKTTGDSADRLSMLRLFYAQRRRDIDNPGIGDTTLEQLLDATREAIAFHIWYFREKHWIQREESGLLSITAKGVDQIELENRRGVIESEPELAKV